jgi:hypothetical protein
MHGTSFLASVLLILYRLGTEIVLVREPKVQSLITILLTSLGIVLVGCLFFRSHGIPSLLLLLV